MDVAAGFHSPPTSSNQSVLVDVDKDAALSRGVPQGLVLGLHLLKYYT